MIWNNLLAQLAQTTLCAASRSSRPNALFSGLHSARRQSSCHVSYCTSTATDKSSPVHAWQEPAPATVDPSTIANASSAKEATARARRCAFERKAETRGPALAARGAANATATSPSPQLTQASARAKTDSKGGD